MQSKGLLLPFLLSSMSMASGQLKPHKVTSPLCTSNQAETGKCYRGQEPPHTHIKIKPENILKHFALVSW